MFVGAGPWGGIPYGLRQRHLDETSTLPGHETETRFEAAIGRNINDDSIQTFGAGILNADMVHNIWVLHFGSATFKYEALNLDGNLIYSRTRTRP